jgi:hypothetical protein
MDRTPLPVPLTAARAPAWISRHLGGFHDLVLFYGPQN